LLLVPVCFAGSVLALVLAGWVLAGCAGWLAGCWLAGAVFGSS